MIRSGAEVLCHQNLVIVAAAVFQGFLLDPVLDKTEARIEPARRFVAHHDTQLDQLDAVLGMGDDCFDQSARNARPPGLQPDIPAPEQALMRLLFSLPDGKSGYSQDFGIKKCSKTSELLSRLKNQAKGLVNSAPNVLPKTSGLSLRPAKRMPRYRAASPGVSWRM